MNGQIQSILIDEERLRERVRELGAQISRDYEGKELLCVGVLKGSVVFLADLIRAITVPVRLDFMAVSSYGAGTESSGVVKLVKDLDTSVKDRHVLIVEDILDSGRTLRYIIDLMEMRAPASVRLCALLDKPERRKTAVQCDYKGFTVPDAFLVGFGLDCNEEYRNLPYVGILELSAGV